MLSLEGNELTYCRALLIGAASVYDKTNNFLFLRLSTQARSQCLVSSAIGYITCSLFNQVIHSGAAPVPCHVCGKEFALKADMRRHLRGHKQGCFKCNVCPAVFANLTHWDNHMNETHPGMPKVPDHDMILVSKHPPHNIRAC